MGAPYTSAMNPTVAVLGAGAMGLAAIKGLLADGWSANQIRVADKLSDRVASAAALGVITSDSPKEAVLGADVVLIAVKPNDVEAVVGAVAPVVSSHQLVISIAAGVTLATLEAALAGVPVIRAMPNTPALLQLGATGIATGSAVDARHLDLAQRVLGAVGLVELVDERLMDAVTAVSGSGPAYVFLLAEAMIDAAEGLGLDSGVASALVLQTVMGAGRLLVEGEGSPSELRAKVTSPGGTTAAAIASLEAGDFRQLVAEAIRAAERRSRELGGR